MNSMTITLTVHDLLLIILTGSVVFAVIYFAVVLGRLATLLKSWQQLSQRIDDLVPKLSRTLEEAEQTLASARTLLREGHAVVSDVSAVTRSAKLVALEAVDSFSAILGPLRTVAAFAHTIQKVLSAILGHGAPEDEKEADDEERDL